MAGLPHSMTRSVSGLSSGRPMFCGKVPAVIWLEMRPWLRKGSRVTVG